MAATSATVIEHRQHRQPQRRQPAAVAEAEAHLQARGEQRQQHHDLGRHARAASNSCCGVGAARPNSHGPEHRADGQVQHRGAERQPCRARYRSAPSPSAAVRPDRAHNPKFHASRRRAARPAGFIAPPAGAGSSRQADLSRAPAARVPTPHGGIRPTRGRRRRPHGRHRSDSHQRSPCSVERHAAAAQVPGRPAPGLRRRRGRRPPPARGAAGAGADGPAARRRRWRRDAPRTGRCAASRAMPRIVVRRRSRRRRPRQAVTVQPSSGSTPGGSPCPGRPLAQAACIRHSTASSRSAVGSATSFARCAAPSSSRTPSRVPPASSAASEVAAGVAPVGGLALPARRSCTSAGRSARAPACRDSLRARSAPHRPRPAPSPPADAGRRRSAAAGRRAASRPPAG